MSEAHHNLDIAVSDYLYFDVGVRQGWIRPVNQNRSRDMCEKILIAALKVFAKKGYRDTKIQDITEAAGCSVGIFYKRFFDKNGLFYALQHRQYELANRKLDILTLVHQSKLSTSEVFHGFVQRTLENMILSSGFHKALIEKSIIDSKANRARKAHVKYAGDRMLDFLVNRGELPETQEMRDKVQFGVGVVFSTIASLVVLGPGPYALKDPRVAENLAEFLLGFLHEEQQRIGISST